MFDFIIKVFYTLFFEEIFVFFPLILLFFYSIFSIFNRKDRSLASNLLIIFLPFTYLFYHYSYLSNFFASIGQDSLLEIDADIGEAIFYIKTFFSFLFDPEIFKRNRFWLLLLSSLFSSIIFYFFIIYFCKIKNLNVLKLNKYFNYVFLASILIIMLSIFNFIKINFEYGKDLKKYEIEFKKNINNYNVHRNNANELIVVTYIGEATSALNLNLYGYPFKTSPWLNSQKQNQKFIKFNNVYATHTHSTPSLKNSLTVCLKKNEKDCFINLNDTKNNLSIVDAISEAGVDTHLYSTQGYLGGHNLASKLVLNTKKKYYSSEKESNGKDSKKFLGDRYVPEIKDQEFFTNYFCKNKKLFSQDKSSLTFLHSYAGHGMYDGYLSYLPKRELFEYSKYINKKNFLGKDSRNFKLLQEYDTAIKYIDDTLQQVVNCSFAEAKENSKPLIFIYFSDHGESPATMRGHDSSRLTYEMLHIPFVIFFNDKAFELYKDKFNFLNNLKSQNIPLKSLSDILIYIFDINIKSKKNNKVVYPFDSFKSLTFNFIMDRKSLTGKPEKIQTFWNFEGNLLDSEFEEEYFKKQDTSINLWLLKNYLEKKRLSDKEKIKNLVCQHRANSFILQYKASLSNGCFETDVHFFETKVVSTHEMKIDTNLKLDDFLKSSYQKNTLWLDSKNIYEEKNCNSAFKWLKKNANSFLSLLVELPTISIENINNEGWKSCVNEINEIENVQVGYYLPTDILQKCSNSKINKLECKKQFSKISSFLKDIKINSITFDNLGYGFIKTNNLFKDYKWHIWNVNSLASFNEIFQNENIGIVLLKNSKFMNNLN